MTELIVTSIPEDDPEGVRRFFEENFEEPPDVVAEVAAAARAGAGKEAAAGPYPFMRGLVDVRGKLPTADLAGHGPRDSRPLSSKRDLIVHYNGVDVDLNNSWGVIYNDAHFHINKNWNEDTQWPPVYGDGLMYHICIGTNGTKYLCRSLEAVLWHCGAPQNYTGLAVQCPLGQNQRASAAQLKSLNEVVSDWLQHKGAPRSVVMGHQEVSPTACPGSLMDQFVRPFREQPPVKPVPFDNARYNFMWANPERGQPMAEWVASRVNEAAGGRLVAAETGEGRTLWIAQEALESQPPGRLVCVAIGARTVQWLPLATREALKVDKDRSDLWDGTTASRVRDCLAAIVARHDDLQDAELVKAFEGEFDLDPAPEGARDPDDLFGTPRCTRDQALALARQRDADMEAAEAAISAIYSVPSPETCWAPDVRAAQAILETGSFRWGGDSGRWNLAGIKKGGLVGDEPKDFEVPPSPEAGAHMQANHGRAYGLIDAVAPVHDRYDDARAAQEARGWPATRISQLGGGVWATDPDYADKVRTLLSEMGLMPGGGPSDAILGAHSGQGGTAV